jgi:anti-sigma factor RsiW
VNLRRLLNRLRWRVRHERDHRWAPSHMSDYLDDDLPAEGRQRMDRHVEECPQCSRALHGLRAVVRGLGGLRERAPESGVVDDVLRRVRDERDER